MTTSEIATTPLISDDEIATLNAARTILKEIENRGGFNSHAMGHVHAAASVAEWHVFQALYKLCNYGECEMTMAQLHNTDADLAAILRLSVPWSK